jgi:ketosteroid isomerase-like protein
MSDAASTPAETVRALLEARAARDAARLAEVLDDSLVWVTPKGGSYDRTTIEPALLQDESWDGMSFTRELWELEPLDDERVLALYDQVYRWDDGLENRVPAGGVFRVRDGKIVEARTFLNADKARAAAAR